MHHKRHLASFILLISLTACSAPAESPNTIIPSESPVTAGELTVQFADIAPIIEQRCKSCHANDPSITRFGKPAGGVLFETPEQIKAKAPRIKARAVDSTSMPTGNLTNMTDAERELLGKWIAQGASLN